MMNLDEEHMGNFSDEEDNISYESDLEQELHDFGQNGIYNKQEVTESQFHILKYNDIVQHMNDMIEEIHHIVDMPHSRLRMLLNNYHWQKDELIIRFYEKDKASFLKDAGIELPKKVNNIFPNEEGNILCKICFVEYPLQEMIGLECEHLFCKECWTSYLTSKIMTEGVGPTIVCPLNDCKTIIEDDMVKTFCSKDVQQKYQNLVVSNFVECNSLTQWCPFPGCNNAIKVVSSNVKQVRCSCDYTFCFSCGEEYHEPITCHLLKKWKIKCTTDSSETTNWMLTNTKNCPKCDTVIEKNGGCNHITCTRQNCKIDFCWNCLFIFEKNYEKHGCNLYEDNEPIATEKDKAKALLKKYTFYSDRYLNHWRSLKFGNKLKETINTDITQLASEYKASLKDAPFLIKAADVLCQCRQTLMYTYAFAYFLEDNPHSKIFKTNQENLEEATEKLSWILERSIIENLKKRHEIEHHFRFCLNRKNIMIDHVNEKSIWDISI